LSACQTVWQHFGTKVLSIEILTYYRSLLPRSVEKRPRRLRLEIEIIWHSKCNSLYNMCLTCTLHLNMCNTCAFWRQSATYWNPHYLLKTVRIYIWKYVHVWCMYICTWCVLVYLRTSLLQNLVSFIGLFCERDLSI